MNKEVNKKVAKEILKGLKWTFLVNFIVLVVFGVLLVFIMEEYLRWFGIPFVTPAGYGLLFGAALLGYACTSFMAWQQTEWEKVKIVVLMLIAWHMLGVFIFFLVGNFLLVTYLYIIAGKNNELDLSHFFFWIPRSIQLFLYKA